MYKRQVVDCVDEDDVVVFTVVVVFYDSVVEGFGEGVVGEFAFAEFHEEVLSSAFGFLIQRKFHVDEVFYEMCIRDRNKTKSRVKGAVKNIAKELVELYAVRQEKEGYVCGPDTVWQKEFEEMFP